MIGGRHYVIEGDQLAWFWAHAGNVALAQRLVGLRSRRQWAKLERLLEQLAERQDLANPKRRAARLLWMGRKAKASTTAETEARRLRAMFRVEQAADEQAAGGGAPWTIPTGAPPWRAPVQLNIGERLRDPGPAATASALVAALVTPNLAGVIPVLDETGRVVLHCRALIQAVYWQIAQRGESIRLCRGCGAWFYPDDQRERF